MLNRSRLRGDGGLSREGQPARGGALSTRSTALRAGSEAVSLAFVCLERYGWRSRFLHSAANAASVGMTCVKLTSVVVRAVSNAGVASTPASKLAGDPGSSTTRLCRSARNDKLFGFGVRRLRKRPAKNAGPVRLRSGQALRLPPSTSAQGSRRKTMFV